MNPYISIILPVYNVERYLPQCLDSLVNQTLEEIEIIAVNDGSLDHSLEILHDYAGQYPDKLKVFSTENRGVSHARNYGYQQACGEYVWFVDSDDYAEPDACEKLYQKAMTDQNDLVLFSRYDVYDDPGERRPNVTHHNNQNFRLSQKPYEMVKISPFPWNKLIKRKLFSDIRFPEGIRFEDLPISFILGAKAHSIGVLEDCLYNYRKKVGFLDSFTPSTLDIQKALAFLRDTMRKQGLFQQYKEELDYLVIRHFFYRFESLLTNYERNCTELKIQLIQQLSDYIQKEVPGWRDNRYVRYTLPERIFQLLSLYGSRDELLKFVEVCQTMTPEEQDRWVARYRHLHRTSSSGLYPTREASLPFVPNIDSIKAYHSVSAKADQSDTAQCPNTGKNVIFIESHYGMELSHPILAILLYLDKNYKDYELILSMHKHVQKKYKPLFDQYGLKRVTFFEPQTRLWAMMLGNSRYIISDCPLPVYYNKKKWQIYLNIQTRSSYVTVGHNKQDAFYDWSIWQYSFLAADYLVFTQPDLKEELLKKYMAEQICRSAVMLKSDPAMNFFMDTARREELRQRLGVQDKQVILCCPQPKEEQKKADPLVLHRAFMNMMHQLDQELGDHQIVYLHYPIQGLSLEEEHFCHIRPVPSEYDLYDFMNGADFFITDYHNAMIPWACAGRKVIRLLYDKNKYKPSNAQKINYKELPFITCRNIGELMNALNGTREFIIPNFSESICGIPASPSVKELCELLLKDSASESADSPAVEDIDARTRVLYFTGRKLSGEIVDHFNQQVAANPDKAFWLSFDALKCQHPKKHLNRRMEGTCYLPIHLDCLDCRWIAKTHSLINRFGFHWAAMQEKVLRLSQKDYSDHFGNATFDEVIITDTVSLRTAPMLMQAAKKITFYFSNFNLEKYSSSREYRHRIHFLLALLKQADCIYLHPDMAELKAIRSLENVQIMPAKNQ